MGKKKSGSSHKEEEIKARAFVLKVAMHCSCDGCIDKIRAAVKDLTRLEGIESWDQSALKSKGEVVLVATADPEKLRQRLHKATRKQVDLLFPNKQASKEKDKDKAGGKDALQALLLNLNGLQQQQQQGGQYGWGANANPLLLGSGGGGWNAGMGYGAQAYPWAAVQQQQQADPYAAYSGGGGAGWGTAYPPAALQGHGGAYYGGAWHGGHGY